jgi:hypothetical protein
LEVLQKRYERNQKKLPWILEGPLNSKRTLRLEIQSKRFLNALCDPQLIKGTGIVISRLSQYNEISFYHDELIPDYWWLTLTVFGSARDSVGGDEDSSMNSDDQK